MGNGKTTTTEYGTSYFGVRDPVAVTRDLDRFAGAGLNAVLHTFSERDRTYYLETVHDIVTVSHERDLTVYANPWGVGNVFGGEALTEFPLRHPQSRQELSNGERVPAVCLNSSGFRQFMQEWIQDACDIGADVILWDEPHWYRTPFRAEDEPNEPWTCRCPHCQDKYEETYGESMPDELTDRVRQLRRNSLIEFLRLMTETVHDFGRRNAVCIAPDPNDESSPIRLDEIASIEYLDILSATPFWDFYGKSPDTFVDEWATAITEICDDRDVRSQLWVQGFGLDHSPATISDFRTAIRTLLSHDPDSLFMWGWDACRVMSSIASESPGEFWTVFLDEISDCTQTDGSDSI